MAGFGAVGWGVYELEQRQCVLEFFGFELGWLSLVEDVGGLTAGTPCCGRSGREEHEMADGASSWRAANEGGSMAWTLDRSRGSFLVGWTTTKPVIGQLAAIAEALSLTLSAVDGRRRTDHRVMCREQVRQAGTIESPRYGWPKDLEPVMGRRSSNVRNLSASTWEDAESIDDGLARIPSRE